MTDMKQPFKITCRILWHNTGMTDTYEWPTYALPEANTQHGMGLIVKEELGRVHNLDTSAFVLESVKFGVNEEDDDEG
jgi:hypothetical protein